MLSVKISGTISCFLSKTRSKMLWSVFCNLFLSCIEETKGRFISLCINASFFLFLFFRFGFLGFYICSHSCFTMYFIKIISPMMLGFWAENIPLWPHILVKSLFRLLFLEIPILDHKVSLLNTLFLAVRARLVKVDNLILRVFW